MCLIISGPSNKIRSTLLEANGLLADIYKSNSDGFGAMFSDKDELVLVKVVPTTLADVRHVVEQLPQDDRNLAVHFRFTTHGDTNLDNCHPYIVVENEVAMMHNGVLATGNARDKSRSDTWHFIQDYLADTVATALDVIHSAGFKSLLGDYIDNNRFVFMDRFGEMSVVNDYQGTSHDGMWFSNEYAWSPELLIPGYRSKYARWYSYGHWADDDDGFDLHNWPPGYSTTHTNLTAGGKGTPVVLPSPAANVWDDRRREKFFEAVMYCDADTCVADFTSFPHSSIKSLLEEYEPRLAAWLVKKADPDEETTALQRQIIGWFMEGITRIEMLRSAAVQHPAVVADVAMYYLEWVLRSDSKDYQPAVQEASDTASPADSVLGQQIRGADGRLVYVSYYLQHRIEVAFAPGEAWCFTMYDMENAIADFDYGFDEAEDAAAEARKHLDETVDV